MSIFADQQRKLPEALEKLSTDEQRALVARHRAFVGQRVGCAASTPFPESFDHNACQSVTRSAEQDWDKENPDCPSALIPALELSIARASSLWP